MGHLTDHLTDHEREIIKRPLSERIWIAGYGYTYYAGPIVLVAIIYTDQFRFVKPVAKAKLRYAGCYYHLDDDYAVDTHFLCEYAILDPQRLNKSHCINLEASKATTYLISKMIAKYHLHDPIITLCRKNDQPSIIYPTDRTHRFTKEIRFAIFIAQEIRRQIVQTLAPIYYEYEFQSNLGAPTSQHIAVLCHEGCTPFHIHQNLINFPRKWLRMIKLDRINIRDYPFHIEPPLWWSKVLPYLDFRRLLRTSEIRFLKQKYEQLLTSMPQSINKNTAEDTEELQLSETKLNPRTYAQRGYPRQFREFSGVRLHLGDS